MSEFIQELKALGIEIKSETNNFKTWCPVCYARKGSKKDKDLSVNPKEGLYQCWSPNCNFKGKVSLKKYERPKEEEVKEYSDSTLSYCKGRGISKQTLFKLKIGDGKDIIKFRYVKNGVYINYKIRNIKEKSFSQFAGAEKVVYNHDSLKDKKKCIITEGEMDVATWVELGFDSEYAIISLDQGAASEGQSLEGKLECLTSSASLLDQIDSFYLAGDSDGPGKYTFNEIAERLGKYKCKEIDFKASKDSNGAYMAMIKYGASREESIEVFKDFIEKATPFPIGGIEVLDNEMIARMLHEYDNGGIRGLEIERSEFSKNYTVLKGEMTGFLGYPGDGKSTALRNLAIQYSIDHNLKYACFVIEDNPPEYFYKDLALIYIGKQIDIKYGEKRATKEEYLSALDYIKSRFFYIYPEQDKNGVYVLPTLEWINGKIKYLKLQYGVNSFIKDPWNKIAHDTSMRDDQYLMHALSAEKVFCKDYIACWYVMHPAKPTPMKDGGFACPTPYSLSGGAMFFNMFDNLICIWRPHRGVDPKSRLVNFITQKIRKKGVVGEEGSIAMNYDPFSKRYYSESASEDAWTHKKIVKGMEDSDLFDEMPF